MLTTKEDSPGSKAAAPHAPAAAERTLLFISHANPEDNAAASWFATQLSLLGYEVWCDVRNTHAGESGFWLKVQQRIENDAAKFIFILSDTSRNFERKQGVFKEVQAASNLRRDNFIIPLRIQKLNGSVPILIGTDIYVNSENWAEGLKELQERLIKDGVPKPHKPDFERIKSWWPAVSAHQAIFRNDPSEVDSNVFPFEALPENIHLLKVSAEGNALAGRDQLKGALPTRPPYATQGPYAISFAQAHDYLELTSGFDVVDDKVLKTQDFLANGFPDGGIASDTARNLVTYLVAASLEHFLGERNLSAKTLTYSRRKIWFPAHGLITNNKRSYADGGGRKAFVWFGGKVSSLRKQYAWHFAFQPQIDLRTHMGVLLSPKVIISHLYSPARGEKPIPIDEKRAVKKLAWWNDDWRKKLLAFMDWLADGQDHVRIPVGYQEIVLKARPQTQTLPCSYLEKDDDEVIREIMGWADA